MKKILATILVLAIAILPMAVSAELIDLVNEDIQITISKAGTAPVIDGKLDEDSYKQIPFDKNNYWFDDRDDDHLDFLMNPDNVKAYISYDDKNLYVFLSGSSDFYFCDRDMDDSGNIWNRSSVQVSAGAIDCDGSDYLETGFARNSETGELVWNIWYDGPDGPDDFEPEGGKDFAIALDGGRLNYEIAIPWTTFLPAAPKVGDKFKFNFIYHFYDNASQDGSDQRMVVEFSAGVANSGKNGDLFATVTLTDEVLQAAAVEEEVPDAIGGGEAADEEIVVNVPKATPTGDAGIIVLMTVMAIASLGVVALRRKAVK